ncbi:hypothetical protein SIN8267_01087 [Sinobacterium norvegicum]|uniref:SGNH hydrolase-type esterase domain-containing protein n=1 Tax=Sinobacterium norvegicum TaxID=1641715 RepID=A0ABM9ADG8_9GAMM|nr:SGNH/GDSL hydrolase family protein [Sinobacterium norvegicum]CAH0990986.1 hypothetical protein SIN8267_01087 [Sinobacterium norvegicum]
MTYHFLTLLLLPFFLVQGLYVRRVTPQLPEPIGTRAGVTGTGPSIRLLIIGDSAAAGVGVDSQDQALLGQLVASLSASHRVTWKLQAFTGDASTEVLARLEAEGRETFDVVVVSVGVNDVTGRTRNIAWACNLQKLIDTLSNDFNAQQIYLSCLPPMHVFPALPQPLRWWLGQRAHQLNAIMADVADSNNQCTMVNAPFPIEKHYIADDGFHPGAPAYALWGRHMAELISAAATDSRRQPATADTTINGDT